MGGIIGHRVEGEWKGGGKKQTQMEQKEVKHKKNTIATFPHSVPSQHFPDSFYFPLF